VTSPQARKGGAFERAVYGYLADQLGHVVKRPRVTTRDVGDIHAGGAAIECKCYPRDLTRAIGDALREAPDAAVHAGLPWPVGVAKRPGRTDPAEQLVVMTLETFAAMLRETLPHLHVEEAS
jgi:hypothetical protein